MAVPDTVLIAVPLRADAPQKGMAVVILPRDRPIANVVAYRGCIRKRAQGTDRPEAVAAGCSQPKIAACA